MNMIKEIVANIPVVIISIIATITGGTAVTKIAQEIQPALTHAEREIQEIRVVTPSDVTPTLTVTPSVDPTVTPTTTVLPTIAPTTVVASNVFTTASLASHNKNGNCYVAYNKVVYNVSNHPSWQNCRHHGTSGGRDITSSFPHSTSYFSTLPKVGTLQNGTNAGSGSTSSGKNYDSDDENEDEREEEHENEDEDD